MFQKGLHFESSKIQWLLLYFRSIYLLKEEEKFCTHNIRTFRLKPDVQITVYLQVRLPLLASWYEKESFPTL